MFLAYFPYLKKWAYEIILLFVCVARQGLGKHVLAAKIHATIEELLGASFSVPAL
jgi:hypothetical protein